MALALASIPLLAQTCSLCPEPEPEDYTGFITALVVSGGLIFTALVASYVYPRVYKVTAVRPPVKIGVSPA